MSLTKRPSKLRCIPVAVLLGPVLAACGSSPTKPDGGTLPAQPEPVSPAGGAQVTTDTPTFTVRNARGFDTGQASYTFRIITPSGARELASATARGSTGEVSSTPAQFRTVSVACLSGRDPYAKSVVDFFLPACSLARNSYNDPRTVLGPPDAGQLPSGAFFGFMSLGEKGYVTVDLEGCAADEPGPDVRVFQSVGMEAVSLYAAGAPTGPFQLVEYRKTCGTRLPGVFSRYCDFDLAGAEIQEARYFRIEDGEIFPCPGDTDSEGADIDAIQILNQRP